MNILFGLTIIRMVVLVPCDSLEFLDNIRDYVSYFHLDILAFVPPIHLNISFIIAHKKILLSVFFYDMQRLVIIFFTLHSIYEKIQFSFSEETQKLPACYDKELLLI